MLFTEVQRSVRLNKKKKSTNISPYPDEVIDRLARAFYSAILACWNSEEGQREFAAWQAEQAHHANKKEIQEVSHWGTSWCTYCCCLWSLAGCVRLGAPCFCFGRTKDICSRPLAGALPVRCPSKAYSNHRLSRWL